MLWKENHESWKDSGYDYILGFLFLESINVISETFLLTGIWWDYDMDK